MTPQTRVESRQAPRWLGLLFLVVFGLLFAYDVWEAVGNLVGVVVGAAGLGTSVSAGGWAILILGVLLPIALLTGSFLLARRRDAISQVLIYLAGLGASAALFLSMNAIYGLGSFLV